MRKIEILEDFKAFFRGLSPGCKFLMIILFITLIVTCISIFDANLEADGNLVTIRTIFSSIVGYILEKSTRSCTIDKKLLKDKVLIVGSMAVLFTLILVLSCIFKANINNPSLILIKNLLFSSVGFLISSSNDI